MLAQEHCAVLSAIIPFGPMNAPAGAPVPSNPPGRRISMTPLGDHCRTTLPCTSLNQRWPAGNQSGPSVNWKPPASFSIVADSGMSAFTAASFRTIVPADGGALLPVSLPSASRCSPQGQQGCCYRNCSHEMGVYARYPAAVNNGFLNT